MEIHELVKTLADGLICLSESYHESCIQRRNRYLIDNSSSCICYLSHAGGGTAYTVRYAKDSGLPVTAWQKLRKRAVCSSGQNLGKR